MSDPPRGPRGNRGPRNRGTGRGGRGASNARSNGNGSDSESSSRGGGQRGRGRGDANAAQTGNRGVTQAFQQAARGGNTSRGSRGSRGAASSGGGMGMGSIGMKRSNEAVEGRYSRLKAMRDQERKAAIAQGTMADPDQPRNLADAITMVGTCPDMCPEYERASRIHMNEIEGPEKTTTVNENGETKQVVDESIMVKTFHRAAAGMDEQLPSDLRPPQVLLRTTNYLLMDLLAEDESITSLTKFLWNRTRAIRNDYSIQQLTKTSDIRIAIECYEKIARYHILSLHQVGGKGNGGENYSWQQDREQLDKTMLSLLAFYEGVKDRYRSPNEAEFRAYWILFQINNAAASVEEKAQTWPLSLLENPRIQRALDIYAAASDVIQYAGPLQPVTPLPIAQQNWQKFWRQVGSKQVSFLMSCVAEINFNVIRRVVLTTISMAYYPGGRKEIQDWTLTRMRDALAFDDENTTAEFIEQSNMAIGMTDNGTRYFKIVAGMSLGNLPEPKPELPKQFFSKKLVDRKRFGRLYPSIVAGMSYKEARDHNMVDPEWSVHGQVGEQQDEGMFVNDGEDRAANAPSLPMLNAAASPFAPTTDPIHSQPAGFGSFGQTIGFEKPGGSGTPAEAPSPFGKPSPFGQPSGLRQAPAMAPEVGSFGAPPQSFSFTKPASTSPATPLVTPATAPALPASNPNPFSNPFTNIGKDLPTSTSPLALPSTTASAPSNPFASFTSSAPTETPKQSAFSLFPPLATPQAISVPEVQVTPPQDTQPQQSSEATQKRVTFQLPPATNGFNFGTTTPNEDPKPSSTPLTAFSLFPTTTPPAKPAEPAPPTSYFSVPKPAAEVSSSVPSAPQPALGTSSFTQAPLPSFSFQKQTPASSANATEQVLAPSKNPFTSGLPSDVARASQSAPKSSFPAFPSTSGSSAFSTTPGSATHSSWEETRKASGLDYISEQLMVDPDRGFFKQYIHNIAKTMIMKAIADEELRQDNKSADDYRRYFLEFKFGMMWKENVVILKAKRMRKGMVQRVMEIKERKARKVQEMGESRRHSRMLTVDEDLAAFKAEREAQRKAKQEVEEQEGARKQAAKAERHQQASARTSAMNSFDLIGQRHIATEDTNAMPPPASRKSRVNGQELSTTVAAARGHKRSKTQPDVALAPKNSRYRITKPTGETSPTAPSISSQSSLSRASLLNGVSMLDIHDIPYGTKVSKMKSPYFRLKAAGFGPTWNQDFSTTFRGIKRPRLSGDDVLTESSFNGTEPDLDQPHKRRRSPLEVSGHRSPARPATSGRAEGANLGNSDMRSSTSSNGGWKRSAEDEALLARARKMREMLEEGENWYKAENEKDEFRRSQELRRSQMGSRTSSQAGSPSEVALGPDGQDLKSLPRFYSRVSRFVPREEYGVRKEKKVDEPILKGKINGTGNVKVNGRGPSSSSSSRQMPPPPGSKTNGKGGGGSWDDAIEL